MSDLKNDNHSFNSNLMGIYYRLTDLIRFNNRTHLVEETIIEDYSFYDLINNKTNQNVLRKVTLQKLKAFRSNWLKYKKDVSYGSELVFAFLDNQWIDVVENYLVPALNSMEDDFISGGFNIDLNFRRVNEMSSQPSNEAILERVDYFYKILLKNGLVKKYYID